MHKPFVANVASSEFAWSDADFDKVQTLIYQRAGISLHDGKHAMVYSRLSRRLRETGFKSFSDYLAWLESNDGSEWQEFINALTTNLTSFFRENHHFQILKEYITSHKTNKQLNIWCCAASTGEEPYSIVMTALDAHLENFDFKLLASDIDSKVLVTAKTGVYRLDGMKNITKEQLKKYFFRGKGLNSGLIKIKPDVQKYIDFITFNLIGSSWSFSKNFDVVFCRNVMIYFDDKTQRKVLEKIHKVMSPGSLLFVGHAENFNESKDLFVLKGKTVYERV